MGAERGRGMSLAATIPERFATTHWAGKALVLASAVAVTLTCSPDLPERAVPPPPAPLPTPAPEAIEFPADEGRHSSSLEWWYYNGHLKSDAGEEFGFHFVIFQSESQGSTPLYASQFGLTDVSGETHQQSARFSMGDQAPDEVTLKLEVGGFGLTIDSLSHQFTVSSNDGSGLKLQLSLEPTPPPMLHNGAGWIGGPNGWTYYYSWPRMKATGSLLRGGRVAALTGAAWMDHQWGDFFVLGKPAGWQWFALQMDDGSSLMLQEFRDINGKPVEAFGTLMEPQTGGGEDIQRVLQPGEYSIEVLDRWRSPATGGEYPSRWHIRVPVSRLDIEVVPVVAGQEITSGVPPAAIYWEGKARVTGTKSGQPVSGDAYVELTGYVEPPPIDWRR